MLHSCWLLCIWQNPAEYGKCFFLFFSSRSLVKSSFPLCLEIQDWTWNDFFVLLLRSPQYKQNPEMFKQTARLWSHVYAGAPVSCPEYTRKIDKLCSMGFEKVCIPHSFFFFQTAVAVVSCRVFSSRRFICSFLECSNSGVVVKILGCGDSNRATAQ